MAKGKDSKAMWVLVPVSYMVSGLVAVRATSVEDAVSMLKNDDEIVEKMPDLVYPEYVDGSYEISTDPREIEAFTEEFSCGGNLSPTFSDIATPAAMELDGAIAKRKED